MKFAYLWKIVLGALLGIAYSSFSQGSGSS